jgi:hypothetical protein
MAVANAASGHASTRNLFFPPPGLELTLLLAKRLLAFGLGF